MSSSRSESKGPYTPALPADWWLKKPFYTRYMLREMTSFFVGSYCALMIVGLSRLATGAEAWAGFVAALASPLSLVYHVLALVFTVYHTVTWFAVTPRTTPMIVGEDFLPHKPIILGQYAAWLVVSLVVLLVAFW